MEGKEACLRHCSVRGARWGSCVRAGEQAGTLRIRRGSGLCTQCQHAGRAVAAGFWGGQLQATALSLVCEVPGKLSTVVSQQSAKSYACCQPACVGRVSSVVSACGCSELAA
ncbi:hypothetical protein CHLRE_04g226811v5 [Chlamydomonas reinhardtii]|uniref:Uncharacterized protein n=1 Tax=Chlamydomonas reinhardtii TaxID=3055 RepID=A0A2K3DUP4_CHLRE|nr:uncharacterized protein CHLRE_04g226811v5 [Chlamydomonas reinhardtii]XP_042925373.1 uncharacterized protein CHLRE_04g226811v5 [Chlamydomonas reinhardtii]PNW84252.1 hypothetical protein CHLRE_04g226811v5 [Chlamydomonas reinhardtii]PNW84253.1 hypothetical protein CHLRE_04g226811v5 [Chlamydomonas reinhardtii]